MYSLSVAMRAVVIVVGIAAVGVFLDRALASSGLSQTLLMRQQSLPGALYILSVINALGYALAVLLMAALVTRGYWRSLFPARVNLLLLSGCLLGGIVFAAFLNNLAHNLLFNIIFGNPIMTGGLISDVVAGNLFSSIRPTNLLSIAAIATISATPFIEELTEHLVQRG